MLSTVICLFNKHFLSTILGKEVWPWTRQLAFGKLAGVGGHSSHQKTCHYFSVTHYKLEKHLQFSSVQLLSRVWLFVTPWTAACQVSLSITNSQSSHNPCPSSWWCHPTISSSVAPFSSCPQSFPASGSFQMSQFFASGGQRIGVSASASVLPMNIQDWFPLAWTGWISLQSKGLSRVFSNTTVQKHQFFGTQLSL